MHPQESTSFLVPWPARRAPRQDSSQRVDRRGRRGFDRPTDDVASGTHRILLLSESSDPFGVPPRILHGGVALRGPRGGTVGGTVCLAPPAGHNGAPDHSGCQNRADSGRRPVKRRESTVPSASGGALQPSWRGGLGSTGASAQLG